MKEENFASGNISEEEKHPDYIAGRIAQHNNDEDAHGVVFGKIVSLASDYAGQAKASAGASEQSSADAKKSRDEAEGFAQAAEEYKASVEQIGAEVSNIREAVALDYNEVGVMKDEAVSAAESANMSMTDAVISKEAAAGSAKVALESSGSAEAAEERISLMLDETMRYRGEVENVSALPSEAKNGDVYRVMSDGSEVIIDVSASKLITGVYDEFFNTAYIPGVENEAYYGYVYCEFSKGIKNHPELIDFFNLRETYEAWNGIYSYYDAFMYDSEGNYIADVGGVVTEPDGVGFDEGAPNVTYSMLPVNFMEGDISFYISPIRFDQISSALSVKAGELVFKNGDAWEKFTALDEYVDEILKGYATKAGLGTVEAIAKGRATGYVFDTVADLDLWLQDENNVSKLVLGDNFYIREVDVPDYWWDGSQKQQLETQKVDLSEYYTKSEVDEQAWDAAAAYDNIVLGDKFAAKADVYILETYYAEKANITNIENDENYIHFGALGLSDNTEYVASEPISTLTVTYPETDFLCSLYFTLASEGDITITLPESKYIGETPEFKNGETWELSIKNGVVVGGKVV